MRRSVREAIVGFSIIGAAIGFIFTLLWLYGVRLGGKTWGVIADFSNAEGLVKRSPVTYRGILVGSVRSIQVTSKSVLASLEINQADLQLPLPVIAVLSPESLLGGNATVRLVSQGKLPAKSLSMPHTRSCAGQGILCNGDKITGRTAASIASVTESLERLLREVENEKSISDLTTTTKQINRAARDISRFLENADTTIAKVDDLIQFLRIEAARARPIITNLDQATADAARAASHVNSVVAAFNDLQVIEELSQAVSNTRLLTARVAAVSDDISSLTADPRVIKAIQDLTVGLGTFFEGLYSVEADDTTR
ncbi:MCE family protein [cyanobiont of Ornithocercus magnificus]|nr:MCE family protein [cyanobiont of Ornithocercus magnificus]